MVRFSCFNTDSSSTKSKKVLHASSEAMQKTVHDSSHIQAAKMPLGTAVSLSSVSKNVRVDAQVSEPNNPLSSRCRKSEDLGDKLDFLSQTSIPQTTVLEKSPSLGSLLCSSGQAPSDGNETDQGYYCDSLDQSVSIGAECSGHLATSTNSQHQRAPQSDFVANNESIFSIADSPNSEKESPEDCETIFSGECANGIGYHPTCTTNRMVTACSLPNIGPSAVDFDDCFSEWRSAGNLHTLVLRWKEEDAAKHEVRLQIIEDNVGCHPTCTSDRMVASCSLPNIASFAIDFDECFSESKSVENLHSLESRWKDVEKHEVRLEIIEDEAEDDSLCKVEIKDHTNSFNDNYDGSSYCASAKDWVIPIMDEVNRENVESSNPQQGDDVPSQRFKIKRIAEWVNDLQHCSTLEVPGADDPPKISADVPNGGLFVAKVDGKASPSMEAAKRYISSLSASSTTAQLSNHGLAVIPYLSAFVGLKVLNLSGNSIVKITSGSLPRGLHALNLSKNKISAVEGLRELTRLRVLDLSYNRLLRIGHGLASCSSLKELYLAGNKISEVEGLHRLLKLTVLDLRFNKISTAKCLGQLAANYNSLQAISLEGNPAQKNVGDDQLKKHLLGLLPRLVYFNRQAAKTSTSKAAADRSVRLGMNSHQFDRGLRLDSKSLRKCSRGASGTRLSSTSVHGRKCRAVTSPRRSRGRAVLPPSRTRAVTSNHLPQQLDLNGKLVHLRSELSMRRSLSERTLGAR